MPTYTHWHHKWRLQIALWCGGRDKKAMVNHRSALCCLACSPSFDSSLPASDVIITSRPAASSRSCPGRLRLPSLRRPALTCRTSMLGLLLPCATLVAVTFAAPQADEIKTLPVRMCLCLCLCLCSTLPPTPSPASTSSQLMCVCAARHDADRAGRSRCRRSSIRVSSMSPTALGGRTSTCITTSLSLAGCQVPTR
eukprot:COSAG01_NODE_1623_length_9708_cov_32.044438_1_plen_196_part_00